MRNGAIIAVIALVLLAPAFPASENTQDVSVLITGFVPFDKWEVNPSQLIAEELNGEEIGNAHIIGMVLPVDFNESFEMVKKAMHTYEPSVVIALGLDGYSRFICIEKIGVNLKREEGWQLSRIEKDGPFLYFSSIPTGDITQEIRGAGIPARQSFFAGIYACNFILYRLMDYIHEQHLNISAGFIHVPPLSSQTPYGMELRTMVEAVRIAITESMKH
ncbi:MAG: peptidase C15 [Thermoplasmata archaeon]|nr:MAG: peptidase C15 [Thermoplasmata archaeon]RLF33278.1 MAG: peptidase C15 [Thermoplasmata archaeon]